MTKEATKNQYVCWTCKKPFYRRGSRIAKTCSFKCRGAYISFIQTSKPQLRKGGYINCLNCGKSVYATPANLKRTKYCSKKCSDISLVHVPRGENHPHWKGGTMIVQGYRYVKAENHPNKNSRGYVMEHRLVMEQMLERYLTPNEEVHHINGVKTDNHPDNLEVTVKKMHFAHVACPRCEYKFKVK